MSNENLSDIEQDVERLQLESRYHSDVTTENLNLQIIKAMLRIIIRLLLYIAQRQIKD